jgi:hypothetical protein
MPEDQFNQIMTQLAVINNIASEANSIARGTAIQMAILFDKFDSLEKRVAALEPKKSNGHI